MPRTRLHDAAMAGDAGAVLALIDEARQRRLAEARAAEAEVRMTAIEAEHRGNARRLAGVREVGSPGSNSMRSSRLSVPRAADRLKKEPEQESFIEANAADALGRTPLHIAAAQGSIAVVDALLQANCNHRMIDKRGRTPLMEAASYGHVTVLETLMYASPTQEAQTEYALLTDCAGWSALHDACYRGHTDACHVLLGPPIDPIWGPNHGLELLGCATAADGATASGNNVGQLMNPQELATAYSQQGAVIVIDTWLDELDVRRDEVKIQRRAQMVAAHQRLALATSMHKMIASKLHNRRLFLPAAWRPSDLLLQAIAGYIPNMAADGPRDSVVQRFLREGFVWRSMQLRRIDRVALWVSKELEEDTSRAARWKTDDPFNATEHPAGMRSATNLPPGTDKDWDVELRMKADADAAEVARHKVRQLALADAEEKRRQEREAAEDEARAAHEALLAAESRRLEWKEASRVRKLHQSNARLARQLSSSLVAPDDSGPLGELRVKLVAVVCSCERGSGAWVAFMERVLESGKHEAQPHCDISLLMSAMAARSNSTLERGIVHRRTPSAMASRPVDAEHKEAEVVLHWDHEEVFDMSADVFEGSVQRAVRLDVEDIGVAEIDLREAPSTSKRWRLQQWVVLADEKGRHSCSAQVQLKWAVPAPPLQDFAAIEPAALSE